MSQISMKNISTANVVVSVPDINFRRELMPGRIIPLTQEEYDNLMFDPGFTVLVQNHYITINGVADEKKVEEDVVKVVESSEIAKMLDNQDVTAIAKFIVTAAPAEKDSLVKLAVDKGITHPGITALIKNHCGVDIIQAISIKHQAEEK